MLLIGIDMSVISFHPKHDSEIAIVECSDLHGLHRPSKALPAECFVPQPQYWQWQYTDAISRVFVQQCVGKDVDGPAETTGRRP